MESRKPGRSMQNVSQVEPSPISAELRAVIEQSARRAAVTAGAMSIANPYAAELPGEFIWRVQEAMLVSLERRFGRRLASRAFWDVRRATRLKGACRRGLYHFGPTEDWPRHLRIVVVMVRINCQIHRFLRLLFPYPDAMAAAAAVYRQTWALGLAWSQCPIADATTAMDLPRSDSALAATGV